MTEADQSFDEYLNGIAWTEAGVPVTRRHGWSITRIQQARQVWNDCMERQNADRARKRPARSREKVPG